VFFCVTGKSPAHSGLAELPVWCRCSLGEGDGVLECSSFGVRLSSHLNFGLVDKCIGAVVNVPQDNCTDGGWALSGASISVQSSIKVSFTSRFNIVHLHLSICNLPSSDQSKCRDEMLPALRIPLNEFARNLYLPAQTSDRAKLITRIWPS
jgi:hypothetical protein